MNGRRLSCLLFRPPAVPAVALLISSACSTPGPIENPRSNGGVGGTASGGGSGLGGGANAGSGGSAGMQTGGGSPVGGGAGIGGGADAGMGSGGIAGNAAGSAGTSGAANGGAAGDSTMAGASGGGSAGAAGAGAAGASGSGAGGMSGSSGAGGQGGIPPLPDPGPEGDGDFEIGPNFTTQPDLTDRGAPKGRAFEFSMALADSEIFDGTDSTLDGNKPVNQTRRISVYVPAQYQDGTPAPVLVLQDGPGELGLVRNALDNLTIADDMTRRIPPFIAVAVQNGGNDSKGSERGLEYDTMSDRYARFIHLEVLPAVVQNSMIKAAYPSIKITQDPNGRGALGCSSGGAAALTMGWFRPDLFRRLVTYSGTFVDQQDDDAPEEAMYPLGAWDYHSGKSLIATEPKKEIRTFLTVGENDLSANDPESTHHNWVMANQRTAAALKANGYHYRFVFARGASHCDIRTTQATLADALSWVWRGYQPSAE
jgi:enterochelin esterase family protein